MIGTKLSDRYEIQSELGRGGMGVVYKASDPMLGRDVAIKVISPNLLNPDANQRFLSEARSVAKMDHPSIVPIHDIGEHKGSMYFVMPVLQGQSLRHFLRSEILTLGDIIEGIAQVSEALEYSHGLGVLHRDIKPENIMVTQDAAGLRFRLMDFGLAKDSNASRMTKTGILVGTMGYMSPEQVRGERCDGRSDIYSLGTVLYECVTGDLPFSGEMQSILYRIVHEIPQSPRAMGVDIDEELEAVVLRCLEKQPDSRYQKAGELVRALRAYRDRHRESNRMLTVMATQLVHDMRPALSPFVGREKELKELQIRLNAAKAGECQFVLVAGDAGIGKTRLLDEVENLARAQQIPILHGRFMEQDGAFPYHGFCELIQDHYRQKETGSSSHHSDLSELGPDLVSLFPMLSEIQDIRSFAAQSSPTVAAGDARGPENKNQIFELLARTLTRLAGGKPLVLVLEDLHGAEISVEALQYIVRRLGPTPTLILGTYRPSELERKAPLNGLLGSFQGDSKFTSLSLGPLSAEEHRKLLSTLLGGKEIDSRLSEQLYDGSEGNPFFAKELVRSLLDAESISEDGTGTWKLTRGMDISSDELPDTIQQAVEKRVAGLPDEMIKILSTAAVMGRSFGFDDLETLLGDVDDLDETVDRLVKEGLVEEDRRSRSDVLTFSSGVVREVLYAKLSRRKRRSLHRNYAELLEKSHHGRLERVYPQLLYHFAEGDEPEKTVEYGLLHAQKSLESFSPEEAIRAAGTALEFLDDEWEGDRTLEGEARMILARSYQMRSEITDGVREAEAAIRVFEREGAEGRIVGSILQASKMLWQARRAEETMALVERGIALARKSPETEAENLVEFLSLAATLANLRAEYVKANAYLQEAEQLKAGSRPEARKEEIPEGGRLVVPFINSVTGIDPSLIGYDDQVEIAANIFETLLATDGEGRLIPLLSEDWEAVDGGRSFVFTLRQGVTFHDGTPLTADAVKRSFEETIRVRGDEMRAAMSVLQGTAQFLAGEADDVSGIKAVSAHRVEFHLTEPLPIYPSLLTETSTGIARRGEADGDERSQGTGPYRLASKEPERIVLERNPAYWGAAPRLEAVEFLPGRSASDIVDGLRSGKFDLTRPLPGAEIEELMRDPRFRHRMVELPGKHTFFIVMNALSGGLARNETVRKALCGVIPVRDVIWQSKGRFAEPATGLIPPGLVGHDPGRRHKVLSREEARERIQSVSTEPMKLTAAISPGNMERHGAVIQALFQLWSEIGVEIEPVTPTLESYNEKSANPEGTDLVLLGWISDYDDPDALTHVLFNSKTGRYRKMFSSAQADEILDQARSESRPEVRVSLYRQFETLLEENGVVLPLFHETNYRIPGPQIRGIRLKSSPPYVNYAEVGKSEKAEAPSPAAFTTRSGGTVRVPNMGPLLKTLDPRNMTHVDEAEIMSCLFETLTRVDEGARVVPFLASRIDPEDGGKRYRFKLRDGIRFHDGRRLSSRDVRFTFERVLARESCDFRWLLASIRGATDIIGGKARELSGFEIHSATEFSVHLESPYPFFTAVLSHLGLSVVPEGVNFKSPTFKEGCVGTGPFRLVRLEPGKRVEMERNPGYWRDGFPQCDSIQFESVGSPGDVYAGFKKGYFSIAHHLSPEQFEEFRRSSEYAGGYREVPNLSVAMLGLNVKKGPLKDPALRRRLAAAVNREAMIRSMSGAAPALASGLIPPGLLGYDASSRSSSQFRAPAAEGGKEVVLSMAASPTIQSMFGPALVQLEKDLTQAGFRLEKMTPSSREESLKIMTEASIDIFMNAWVADYPDSHAIVHGILDSREGQAGRFCGSPEMDRRIGAAQSEIDPTTRHAMYREIEEIVARETLVIPLFYIQIYRFARPEVEGLNVSFSPPDVHYEELRVRT